MVGTSPDEGKGVLGSVEQVLVEIWCAFFLGGGYPSLVRSPARASGSLATQAPPDSGRYIDDGVALGTTQEGACWDEFGVLLGGKAGTFSEHQEDR